MTNLLLSGKFVCLFVCVCVCLCVSACVCACMRACVHACACVCLSVCLSFCLCICSSFPRALITTQVKCICSNWLNQSYSFLVSFIQHLPLINRMDVALVTQHIVNPCQRRQSWHCTSHRKGFNNATLVTRQSASVIKVSGCMHSDAFK